MGKIEKILTVLEAGDFTAKQIQQQTGIDNIHVLLWHLIKKAKIKKDQVVKENANKGPKKHFIYSLIKAANPDGQTTQEERQMAEA